MPEKDLQRFLKKVDQLQKLVDSLEEVKGRRELLASCHTHDEVIALAESWGYQIGKRWGED